MGVGDRGEGGGLVGLDLGLRSFECKWELHCGVCCREGKHCVGGLVLVSSEITSRTTRVSSYHTSSLLSYTLLLLLLLHISFATAFCACGSVVDADCVSNSVECF